MLFRSFSVELPDCTFLKGSQVTEREIYISTQGSLGALDFERNKNRILELVTIKVQKQIDGIEHFFYSEPLSTSVDNLRIGIEFLKSVIVFYNEENPSEYYFEFK